MNGATISPARHEYRGAYYPQIFLVAFATLLLEISYTRVISFKLFYYFTYLIIGLALLGLGAGGVIVAVSTRLRRASTPAIVRACALASAASVPVGYLVVAGVKTNTLEFWDYGQSTFTNGSKLLVICLAILAPFLPAGIILSALFGRRPQQMGRLYFADLVGAGLACLVVVPLLARGGPPRAIMLAAVAFVLCFAWTWNRRGSTTIVAVVLVAVCSAAFVRPGSVLPDITKDLGKTPALPEGDPLFTSWSPLFRVDVFPRAASRALKHDGLGGSVMRQWDGNVSSLDTFGYERDIRLLPFSLRSAPPDRVAILGAAAGNEVMASLFFGANQIDAIEINPVTYDLVTEKMADYVGHVATNPRVNYELADGRTYMARTDHKYDIIWLPAPDSYSATNASTSSAFVLSESYLYTSEAVQEYLEHLSRGGIVAAQFGEMDFVRIPNRTARYVATAIAALKRVGVDDPRRHILVASAPRSGPFPGVSTILVKRTPFTPAEIDDFVTAAPNAHQSSVAYAPGRPGVSNAVSSTVQLRGTALEDFRSRYPYSIGPISDDRPFFWHFTEFGQVARDVSDSLTGSNVEIAVGERTLLLLLGIAVLLAGLFLFAPFVLIRKQWVQLPRKATSFLYFSGIGLGFIFLEITLIQRFILFLGYPTYSLTVTLASLLIFLGIGALVSTRIGDRHRLPIWLPIAVGALFCYYLFGLTPTTDALLHTALWIRIGTTFLLLAPLGLCLGMFMPLGIRAVAALTDSSEQYVAWGWAVNGFASVIGSVLATIVAMSYGFQLVLYVAFAIYVLALFALWRLAAPNPA